MSALQMTQATKDRFKLTWGLSAKQQEHCERRLGKVQDLLDEFRAQLGELRLSAAADSAGYFTIRLRGMERSLALLEQRLAADPDRYWDVYEALGLLKDTFREEVNELNSVISGTLQPLTICKCHLVEPSKISHMAAHIRSANPEVVVLINLPAELQDNIDTFLNASKAAREAIREFEDSAIQELQNLQNDHDAFVEQDAETQRKNAANAFFLSVSTLGMDLTEIAEEATNAAIRAAIAEVEKHSDLAESHHQWWKMFWRKIVTNTLVFGTSLARSIASQGLDVLAIWQGASALVRIGNLIMQGLQGVHAAATELKAHLASMREDIKNWNSRVKSGAKETFKTVAELMGVVPEQVIAALVTTMGHTEDCVNRFRAKTHTLSTRNTELSNQIQQIITDLEAEQARLVGTISEADEDLVGQFQENLSTLIDESGKMHQKVNEYMALAEEANATITRYRAKFQLISDVVYHGSEKMDLGVSEALSTGYLVVQVAGIIEEEGFNSTHINGALLEGSQKIVEGAQALVTLIRAAA